MNRPRVVWSQVTLVEGEFSYHSNAPRLLPMCLLSVMVTINIIILGLELKLLMPFCFILLVPRVWRYFQPMDLICTWYSILQKREIYFMNKLFSSQVCEFIPKTRSLCSALKKKKPNNILLEGCKQFRKIKLTKYFLLCPGSSPQYISHFGVLF